MKEMNAIYKMFFVGPNYLFCKMITFLIICSSSAMTFDYKSFSGKSHVFVTDWYTPNIQHNTWHMVGIQ